MSALGHKRTFSDLRRMSALPPKADIGLGLYRGADATMTTELPTLEGAILPPGVRARFVENINGLRMHVLEAGFETPGRPCLLLLHGFPELAYSWRKMMGPLAAAGFHVVAPDQRGYGRTTGWDSSYDGDAPVVM
jgi:hypothetical protein